MNLAMRVGIIGYGIDTAARAAAGIGRYTLQLLTALSHLTVGPDVLLLTANKVGSLPQIDGLRRVPLPGCRLLPGLMTLGNVWIRPVAHRYGLDVVHDPTGVTPFVLGAGGARTVVTVHDVFAWSCPGHSTLLDTLIYRHWLPLMLPRVDAVITDSHASKADILRYLKIPSERTEVVYPGVSAAYHPVSSDEAAQIAARYGLPPGYILFVGSVEERKNLRRLLHACARLWQRGEERPLVLVGAHKWKYSRITQTMNQLELGERVIFTGYVPDGDLPALYSAAHLFAFPSLYEGFGLPPLEAMACGIPVVCSNAGSLPEVVGDAAVTVDPYDVEGLAHAMHRVLTDRDVRQELREKGLARARRFTWAKAARETVAVYRKVLGAMGNAPTDPAQRTEGTEATVPTEPTETTGAIDAKRPAIPPACQRGDGQTNPRLTESASA